MGLAFVSGHCALLVALGNAVRRYGNCQDLTFYGSEI